MKDMLAEVRQSRDDWKAQAERLALAAPIPAPAPLPAPPPGQRRPWWRRLAGWAGCGTWPARARRYPTKSRPAKPVSM